MNIPSITFLIKNDKLVRFHHYQCGELWYQHDETGFQFPVPINDTGDGVFLSVDKALLFLRWIRRHVDRLNIAKVDMYRDTRDGNAGLVLDELTAEAEKLDLYPENVK